MSVLSNVAGAGFSAMTSISASPSAMPVSSAFGNASIFSLSHGGTPPYGPVHGASSGSASASTVSRLTSATAASSFEGSGGGGGAGAAAGAGGSWLDAVGAAGRGDGPHDITTTRTA